MQNNDAANYRGSFPAGFHALVGRLLERDFGKGALVSGDESAVLFRAPFPLREPAYVQTLALVVDAVKATSLEEAYRRLTERADRREIRLALQRAATDPAYAGRRPARFAIRGFVRGEPSSVRREERAALERIIERDTGLRTDSERPDLQLQVSLREDGSVHFLASARGAKADDRRKGALPASTARLLCELSLPAADDVFLDPFMGSGSIPLERSRMGPYSMIFAGDADEELLSAFKEALKAAGKKSAVFERKRRTIYPKLLDARDLSRFEAAFFSVIVTDPPWGLFEKTDPEELFALYAAFLREAARVLKEDGRLVLLLGRDSPFEKAAAASGARWRIEEDYSVLVAGRKARALRLGLG